MKLPAAKNNMYVCSVISKQKAMKAIWDSDLREQILIEDCEGLRVPSTALKLIGIIKL